MPHTASNLLVHFIKHQTTISSYQTRDRKRLARVLRRHHQANWRKSSHHQRHRRPRAFASPCAHNALHCGYRPRNQSQFFKMGARRWVHEKWPKQTGLGWQTGYGAFSVSESGASAVQDYILRQREHHRNKSFQDEYLALLNKNHIIVDERYLRD